MRRHGPVIVQCTDSVISIVFYSLPVPRPPAQRSPPAPSFFATPTHRSAPLHPRCMVKMCNDEKLFNKFRPMSHQSLDYSDATLPLINNKMLSYRRETALQGALQFSSKVEDWNWETIFYGHYRSILLR